jgi:hypothetical protein
MSHKGKKRYETNERTTIKQGVKLTNVVSIRILTFVILEYMF